jgi:hypothetical protein
MSCECSSVYVEYIYPLLQYESRVWCRWHASTVENASSPAHPSADPDLACRRWHDATPSALWTRCPRQRQHVQQRRDMQQRQEIRSMGAVSTALGDIGCYTGCNCSA